MNNQQKQDFIGSGLVSSTTSLPVLKDSDNKEIEIVSITLMSKNNEGKYSTKHL